MLACICGLSEVSERWIKRKRGPESERTRVIQDPESLWLWRLHFPRSRTRKRGLECSRQEFHFHCSTWPGDTGTSFQRPRILTFTRFLGQSRSTQLRRCAKYTEVPETYPDMQFQYLFDKLYANSSLSGLIRIFFILFTIQNFFKKKSSWLITANKTKIKVSIYLSKPWTIAIAKLRLHNGWKL